MTSDLHSGSGRHTTFDRIWFDPTADPPQLTVGKTSLSVADVLAELRTGTDMAQLVEAFPMLALDDVSQCLAFADAAALLLAAPASATATESSTPAPRD